MSTPLDEFVREHFQYSPSSRMRNREQIEKMLATANAICMCQYPDNPRAGMDYEAAIRNALAWVLDERIPDNDLFDSYYYGLGPDA